MSPKLLIAIPYYNGDRDKALSLAGLITAIEPAFRDDVEICFVPRLDAIPPTPLEMKPLMRKFSSVHWYLTQSPDVGHPKGSNGQARDFFNEAQRRYFHGEWRHIEAILYLEPDSVPIARDWINQLMREWAFGKKYAQAYVVGCFRSEGVDVPHINGVALYAPDVAHRFDFSVTKGTLGWDSAMAEQFSQAWMKTSLISNLWKETNVPDERFQSNPFTPKGTPPPVLIHGVKDGSALNYAKKILSL